MSTSFSILEPAGHLIKVRLLDSADEKFNGTCLLKPVSVVKGEEVAAQEAIVLEVGVQAYGIFGVDENRSKPWCKVGDHILIKKYTCIHQEDCNDDDDRKIGITKDENVIGVFRHDRK